MRGRRAAVESSHGSAPSIWHSSSFGSEPNTDRFSFGGTQLCLLAFFVAHSDSSQARPAASSAMMLAALPQPKTATTSIFVCATPRLNAVDEMCSCLVRPSHLTCF